MPVRGHSASMKISQVFLWSILLQASAAAGASVRGAAKVGLKTVPHNASDRVSATPAYDTTHHTKVRGFFISKLKEDDKGNLYLEDYDYTDVSEWATWPTWALIVTVVICAAIGGFIYWQLLGWGDNDEDEKVDRKGMFGNTIGEDKEDDGFKHHFIPWEQYFAIGFWYCLLIANAALTRLICKFGVPHDCHERADSVRGLESLDRLLSHGFILAILTGVAQPERFSYLFSFTMEGHLRGLIFLVVFFCTPPVYGALDLIPALSQISITSGGGKSPIFFIVIIGLLIGAVALILFQIVWAAYHNTWQGFAVFIGTRSLVIGMYIWYFCESEKYDTMSFHLHHYMIGFMVAILAEFNHPISLLLLAIGSGIFVQGLAAYDADPLIYRNV